MLQRRSLSTPSFRRPVSRRASGWLRALGALAIVAMLSGCMTGQSMSRGDGPGDVRIVDITQETLATVRNPAMTLPAELTSYRPDTYRVQAGDMVQVTVWDHPELTTPAGTMQNAALNGRLVYPDGTMFYPYVGTLKVEGMTIEELRSTLTTRLSKYLRNPQLDVNVINYGGQVTLQGAFSNPAPQNVTTVPLTVSKAVGAAGVNLEEADLSGLILIRDGRRYTIDLDMMNRTEGVDDVFLKPGDRLYLPFNDRRQVYVTGEVVRPQALTFRSSDMSLTQALGRVGGLNQITSNGDAVYVIRGVDPQQLATDASGVSAEQATVYRLQAKSASAYALASNFPLRAGDMVFVGAAGITRWNRFLSQLLPLSGIISSAASAQNNFTSD